MAADQEEPAYRVTAVHTGLLVGLFWVLVWAAFLSLQLVEDGTLFSLIVGNKLPCFNLPPLPSR